MIPHEVDYSPFQNGQLLHFISLQTRLTSYWVRVQDCSAFLIGFVELDWAEFFILFAAKVLIRYPALFATRLETH